MFNIKIYINVIYSLFLIQLFGTDVSSSINLHRYKRASGTDVNINKYLFGGSIELQCFDPPKDKEDVVTYFWTLESSKFSKIEEQDIIDYEIYDKGTNYGDLKIFEPQVNIYHCNASLTNEKPYTRRSYSLIRPVKPETPNLVLRREILGKDVTLNEGKEYTLKCTAEGGVPNPNITLMLDGEPLNTINNADSIEMKLNFNHSANGKTLHCKVDHILGGDENNVKLDITYKPVDEPDATGTCEAYAVDQDYNLHFNFLANPKPNDVVTWSYSNDCQESEDLTYFDEKRYSFSLPKLVKGTVDRYTATITISRLEEADHTRCFFLLVTNEQGKLKLQREIIHECKTPEGSGNGVWIGLGITALVLLILGIVAGVLYKKRG